jgi:protein O-GlcNAc transferase
MKNVSITYTRKLLAEAGGSVVKMTLPPAVLLPARDRRLRLGYVSADFKDHPVAKRMQDIYALHDRARVRVTCYCLNANDRSSWRLKIEAAAERFLDLHVMLAQQGPGAVAMKIAADEADVLINLMGHTRGSDPLTLIMAARPAPTQLMHEGYAGTMGGAEHTAHVTDRYSSPPDFASHYVEKLLYMPHAFFVNDHRQTYAELMHDVQVEGEEKASRLAFGSLPPDIPLIYSAFNQLYKVEPGIWDTWMEVMRQVPASHLWMIRIHTRDPEYNLKSRAVSLGVPAERIHVVQVKSPAPNALIPSPTHLRRQLTALNASTSCRATTSGSTCMSRQQPTSSWTPRPTTPTPPAVMFSGLARRS